MKMLFDNILIKPVVKGKVIIKDRQGSVPAKGEVISVGPGEAYGYPDFMKTTVQVGDKVQVIRDRCLEIEINGETYYVCREREILGILEKGEE